MTDTHDDRKCFVETRSRREYSLREKEGLGDTIPNKHLSSGGSRGIACKSCFDIIKNYIASKKCIICQEKTTNNL